MSSRSIEQRPPLAVVVLAAGHGTRMKSRRAKVLHEIAGRPMLAYPIALAESLAPDRLVVVIGRGGDAVQQAFAERARFVVQAEQRGTGHAVQTALPALEGFEGEALILYGDCPLLRPESVERLRTLKAESKAPLALLTSPEPLPGLVVRGSDGRVQRIVEQTDASPEELEIREATRASTWSISICCAPPSTSWIPRMHRPSSTSRTWSRSRMRAGWRSRRCASTMQTRRSA
jgi:bifunctional UDP-N-acetylglucosamine pyrophosphorylase/glucosamine-1-phosphate N-acetyltransferase